MGSQRFLVPKSAFEVIVPKTIGRSLNQRLSSEYDKNAAWSDELGTG